MDVSVILVTYNAADCVAACLESVVAQKEIASELIVVDNASADKTLSRVKPFNARCLANTENVGYGRANNQGFAISSGRFLLLLNPDSVLTEPGALRLLCNALDTHPGWGMASPRILSVDGMTETLPADSYPGQRHVRRDFSKLPGRIAWVMGASMIIRREIYAALGGFDPAFFLYSEETDLCLRLRELGHEIGYVPEVTTRHIGGASERGRDPYEVARRKMTGLLLFRQKHYAPEDAIRLARRDLARARFRMTWYGGLARLGGGKKAQAKLRQYAAIRDLSRDFLEAGLALKNP